MKRNGKNDIIEHEILTETQKKKILDIVGKCSQCGISGDHKTLTMHRINRGYAGGKYILRNILILCKDECHKSYHQSEIMGRKG